MPRKAHGIAYVLAALLVGCGGDSPDALIADIERAWERGDMELLERRVDVEGVIGDLGVRALDAAREQLGQGFLATLALADVEREMNAARQELSTIYRRARETGDFAALSRDMPALVSADIEEAGGVARIRTTMDNPTGDGGRWQVLFSLAQRNGRWMVVGVEDLRIR